MTALRHAILDSLDHLRDEAIDPSLVRTCSRCEGRRSYGDPPVICDECRGAGSVVNWRDFHAIEDETALEDLRNCAQIVVGIQAAVATPGHTANAGLRLTLDAIDRRLRSAIDKILVRPAAPLTAVAPVAIDRPAHATFEPDEDPRSFPELQELREVLALQMHLVARMPVDTVFINRVQCQSWCVTEAVRGAQGNSPQLRPARDIVLQETIIGRAIRAGDRFWTMLIAAPEGIEARHQPTLDRESARQWRSLTMRAKSIVERIQMNEVTQ